MRLTKDLFIPFIIIFSIGLTTGCSSSSGSLRYSDNNQNEVEQKDKSLRYESVNVSNSDDSLSVLEDEDVPEFQDPSDLPEDESKIDLTSLLKKLEDKSSNSDVEYNSASKKDLMLMEIIRYINTPYKYGGNSLNGIDCSAFTQNVYRDSWLLDINRSAREQYKQGMVIGHVGIFELHSMFKLDLQACLEIFRYTQEIGSDPLGIGDLVRAKFPAYWQRVDWRTAYRETTVKLSVKLNILQYGAIH